MKKIILLYILFCICLLTKAQTQFFGTVKIEFEKTVALQQLAKEMWPDWYERMKDNMPQQIISYGDFTGDSTRSVYKPGRELPVNNRTMFLSDIGATKNVVYNDYKTETTITQKPVYEETFLVEDSLSKIKWKLTADIRTIAGYECRKAIGILNDSITVFAFYADDIMISGGPESIHGLPGMILGAGIPRIHTTWFATKVEVFDVNMKAVSPATKGKKITRAGLSESLRKALKEWESFGDKLIMIFSI